MLLKKLSYRLQKVTWCVFQHRHYANSSRGSEKAVQLAYESKEPEEGVEGKAPIIVLHGLLAAKNNLSSLSKAMARNRKVITVDCRNHGDSPHTADMSYHLMAADIELLLSQLNIPHAIFFGHSMGGRVAMTVALTKPHLVSKLVVEDISPRNTKEQFSSKFPEFLRSMSAVRFDDSLSIPAMRRSVVEQLKEAIPVKAERNFILTNIVRRDNRYFWKLNIESIAANLHNINNFPTFDSVYTGPTLFIGGSKSMHIRESDKAIIMRLFPQAEIMHIEGAGHWIHAEKPEELIAATMQFINHEHS